MGSKLVQLGWAARRIRAINPALGCSLELPGSSTLSLLFCDPAHAVCPAELPEL